MAECLTITAWTRSSAERSDYKENAASGRMQEKCSFTEFFAGEDPYQDGVYEISKSVWKRS